MEIKDNIKKLFIGSIIYFILFLLIFCSFTFIPSLSFVSTAIENYKIEFSFRGLLIILCYRFLIYFLIPLLISFVKQISKTTKSKSYLETLISEYNFQFFGYFLLSSIWSLSTLDLLLNNTLFNSIDAFIFIVGFILSLLLKLPEQKKEG